MRVITTFNVNEYVDLVRQSETIGHYGTLPEALRAANREPETIAQNRLAVLRLTSGLCALVRLPASIQYGTQTHADSEDTTALCEAACGFCN